MRREGGEWPGRPALTVKIAQTVDGRVATTNGDSKWITSEEARRSAHALRAQHDAILVGIGTVLADDPQLTVRHVEGDSPRPIVLDSSLRIPLAATVLHRKDAMPIVATTSASAAEKKAVLQAMGARVLVLPSLGSRPSLPALLEVLDREGIGSVLIEGGPTVATAFLRERLADRLVVYVAPRIIGMGREAVGDLGIERVRDAIVLRDASWVAVGPDMVLDGVPHWGDDTP